MAPPQTASSTIETNTLNASAPIIESRNPANGAINGQVLATLLEESPVILDRARNAQAQWASLPLKTRLHAIERLQSLLYERHEALVELLGRELGKIEHEARFEILQPLVNLKYMIWKALKVLKPRRVFVWQLPHRTHTILRQPHGVVLVISPWNFPVVLAFDAIIPALIAGNSVVFKPSEYTPLIGQSMADLIHEAGVPEDVFQIAQGAGDLGAALIEARPDNISFTGSVAVGRKIAQQAGDLLIPVTLELGGKDAALVLEDANLRRTARGILWGSMVNAGQMCLGIERVYVIDSIATELVKELRQAVRKYMNAGMPTDSQATLGMLTLPQQVKIIKAQVKQAEEMGATIYREHKLAPTLQAIETFVEPLILTDVPSTADIMHHETFGPVMVVIPIADEDEAIEQINESNFGLTASIWTNDGHRARHIAEQLKVSLVNMNDHIMSSAAPQIPWGGRKQSGYGRNRGADGFLAMTVTQSISIEWLKIPINPFGYPYNSFKRALVRRLVHLWMGPTLRAKLKGLGRLK